MTIAETVYEKLKAAPPEVAREVLDFLELLEAKKRGGGSGPAPDRDAIWEDFFGSLKGSGIFEGDPMEIQRKMRDEWDR